MSTAPEQIEFVAYDSRCLDLDEQTLSYVKRSWLEDYRTSLTVKRVPASVYYRWEAARIAGIMRAAEVCIAYHLSDEKRTMPIGFLVHTGNWLHWLHVRELFRQFGVAKYLLQRVLKKDNVREHPDIVITHYYPPLFPLAELFQNRTITYHPYYGLDYDEKRLEK